MVKIDYSTVSTIFRGEEASCSDELINNFARTLYEFFKRYSFGEIYVLQNCANVIIDLKLKRNAQGVFSKQAINRIRNFNALGIYFEGLNSTKDYIEPIMNYIVLSEGYVDDLCKNYHSMRGKLKAALVQGNDEVNKNVNLKRKANCCIADCSLQNKNLYDCIKIVEEIEGSFSKVTLLNKDLYTVQINELHKTGAINVDFYKKTLTKCVYMNLYRLIYENCIKNVNDTDNTVGAKRLLVSILKEREEYRKKGYNLVFYYRVDPEVDIKSVKGRDMAINDMNNIYASFYALLTTKYCCSCIKTAGNAEEINSSTFSLLAKDNMYAKDYLEMLDKFPDVTTYYSNTMGYYCVIDYNRLQRVDPNFKREYKYEVTMTNIKYNPETKRWLSTKVEEVNYDYHDIKVLDFHDYFALNCENITEAKKGIIAISDLTKQFQNNLKNAGYSPTELLNQGNMLLYEYDGNTYLGFISSVTRKLPFIVFPMDDTYEPFKMDLTNHSNGGEITLNKLQSIFTDLDWKNTLDYLAKKGAKFFSKRLKFKLGDYSDGIIFSNILFSYFNSTKLPNAEHAGNKLVFATTDELGIWCESSRQFRKYARPGDSSYYNTLTNIFDIDALMDKDYLTFFGGPHPYDSTVIRLMPNLIKIKEGRYA